MKQLTYVISLISCLLLVGAVPVLANGKGDTSNSDFGRGSAVAKAAPNEIAGSSASPGSGESGKKGGFSNDAHFSRTRPGSDDEESKPREVVEGTIDSWEQDFGQFGWTLSDWDLQRLRTVHAIAQSPQADTPLIQRFLARYGQAVDFEGRRLAITELLDAIASPLGALDDFSNEAFAKHLNELDKVASRESVELFMKGYRLLDIEALLHTRMQTRAETACSGNRISDSHCLETAQR